jgi:hypothetical protein
VADLLLGSTHPAGEPLSVESAELTTHGVIVGMTGSGKTGSESCCSRRRC